MRNQHQEVKFFPVKFTVKFLRTFFCLQTILQKIQISKAQSNWFIFQEEAAYKRQGRADLHTSDMNRVKWVRQAATHSYGFYFLLFI